MEMPINVKRAAAYCRVSTDLEIQEGSFELQKRYYKELLSARRDVELVRIYGDEGSGRSIRHRPEFSQMLSDCEAGQIDVIYTKSFSRFSRSLIDFVTVIRRLRELGIPVIFEKEGINSMDSQNELLMHILAIVAQEESKSIAENVKWSIEKRHSEGKPTGKVPYGYRRIDGNGHWSIEDGEADRVRLAFSLAESGACYQAIRAELDEIEIREHTGISWSHNRSRLPLMLMENCVIANSLGCGDVGSDYRKRSAACRCGQENVLTDRTGARFPLMPAWGHRNELENSRTLFLADKPEWRRLGLTYARLRFTTESPAKCVAALQRYQGQGDYIPADLTRGLFYRGVE